MVYFLSSHIPVIYHLFSFFFFYAGYHPRPHLSLATNLTPLPLAPLTDVTRLTSPPQTPAPAPPSTAPRRGLTAGVPLPGPRPPSPRRRPPPPWGEVG